MFLPRWPFSGKEVQWKVHPLALWFTDGVGGDRKQQLCVAHECGEGEGCLLNTCISELMTVQGSSH